MESGTAVSDQIRQGTGVLAFQSTEILGKTLLNLDSFYQGCCQRRYSPRCVECLDRVLT